MEGLGGIKIINICAGGWHSCALSQDGDVYTWGWNGNGQLGLGTDVSVMATPSVVDFGDPGNQIIVMKVSCGVRHTIALTGAYFITLFPRYMLVLLFLTDDKKLYGCGWNKYKQIDNSDEENIARMKYCHDFNDFRVIDLKCGPWSSLVLCD